MRRRSGLPPGPIGGHRFAATLREHQQNVRAYREVQRAAPR